MGVRTFQRRDGSEGIVHIANLGKRNISTRVDCRVHHNGCHPGFIIQRLDGLGRPTGKLFCASCKNTLGRRVFAMFRSQCHTSCARRVRWELIPSGARFKDTREYLEGDHRLLYIAPMAIKPLGNMLLKSRRDKEIPKSRGFGEFRKFVKALRRAIQGDNNP